MAGSLKVFHEVVAMLNGERLGPFGSREEPVKEVAFDGAPVRPGRVVIPAGEARTIYTWSLGNDFKYIAVTANGAFRVRWKVDKPTSASNKAPAGTHINWERVERSCFGVLDFDTDRAQCASTPADLVSSAGGGASIADGYIYQIDVVNTGTEELVATFGHWN